MSSAVVDTLAELRGTAFVRAVRGDDDVAIRLLEMGLTPGTEIAFVRKAPMGDPVEFAVRGYRLSLRVEEARRVQLTREPASVARAPTRNWPVGAPAFFPEGAAAPSLDQQSWIEPSNPVSARGAPAPLAVPDRRSSSTEPEASSIKRVVLLGNPNSGKTTLFNALCSAQQKVGNYAGVTIEATQGQLTADTNIAVCDLPGTYSLSPVGGDEVAATDALRRLDGDASLTLVIADCTALARGLFLFVQAQRSVANVALCLTMSDELHAHSIDVEALATAVDVPVFLVSGRSGQGLDNLSSFIRTSTLAPRTRPPLPECPYREQIELDYARVDALMQAASAPAANAVLHPKTQRLDRYLLHPAIGVAVFLSVIALLFTALFTWVTPISDGIEWIFARAAVVARNVLGDSTLADLLVHGVLQGAGNVVTFVPQIALLSFAMVVLEDSGYLARVAFVIDRTMRAAGLHGRAFIPMLSGFACAVPAIIATRTLASKRDRLVTMLALPLMSCSARLPVFLLVTGTLMHGLWGAFALFMMYLLSSIATILAASLIRRFVVGGQAPALILELPPYRMPLWRNAARETYKRVTSFVGEAGTTILALTIVLWGLLYFPKHPDPSVSAREKAEYSYAGRIGKTLEPIVEPLGFDWRIGVGLVGSFAAREVFVSTMGLIYGVSDDNVADGSSLETRLRAATWPDGRPVFTLPTGVALMVFFVLAAQCMSTLAVLRRESGAWRWPAFALVYMNVLAWIAAYAARQLMLRFVA